MSGSLQDASGGSEAQIADSGFVTAFHQTGQEQRVLQVSIYSPLFSTTVACNTNTSAAGIRPSTSAVVLVKPITMLANA